MRDGAAGLGWHGGRSPGAGYTYHTSPRILVSGAGSPEHTRHVMLRDLYHNTETGREMERRAGAVRQPAGHHTGVPGLDGSVHSMERLADRLDVVMDAFRRDGPATLQNARDDSHNAPEVPDTAP